MHALAMLLSMICLSAAAIADDTKADTEADDRQVYRIDLPEQSVADALTSLSEQTDVLVLFPYDIAEARAANPVKGEYTLQEALDLLLQDTGLSGGLSRQRVMQISLDEVAERTNEEGGKEMSSQGDGGSTAKRRGLLGVLAAVFSVGAGTPEAANTDEEETVLEEIVVTGTNIRGVAPIGSPVLVFDRDSIDKAGFATVQQFLETVPQNFGGGAAEDTRLGQDATDNVSGGSGVNFRGLGGDSTLILLNGRRLAQGGGVNGNFVDVSSLPLSAIERVEVLTDGASAVYGSDAIAGAVNFVMRTDYDGAETQLRFGTVTDGGLREYNASQVFGRNWNTGNLLFSYEFLDRPSLGSEERDFTADSDLTRFGGDNFGFDTSNPGNFISPARAAIPKGQDGTKLTPDDLLLGETNLGNRNEGRDVLPAQQRHAVFLTGRQELTGQAEVYTDILYSKREFERRVGGQTNTSLTVRDSNPFFVSPVEGATSVRLRYNFINDLGAKTDQGDVETFNAALGFTARPNDEWEFDVFANYGSEDTTNLVTNSVDRNRLTEALGTDDPDTAFDPLIDGFFNPFADGSNSSAAVLDYIRDSIERNVGAELLSINARARGDLFALPGGIVKVAIGGEYREEEFDFNVVSIEPDGSRNVGLSSILAGERDVIALYGEVFVPLIGPNNAIGIAKSLDVSAALRSEDYSDFGSTNNPKFGFRWGVTDQLDIRGSYGTSFKAPRLADLNGFVASFATQLSDPASPSGFSFGIVRQGANTDLTAEESTSWTVGADFRPQSLTGFELSASYFDIEFDNRISPPSGSAFTILTQPDLFASLIERDPSSANIEALINSPEFIAFGPLPEPTDVAVIVDGRTNNIASTNLSGIDLNASFSRDYNFGSIVVGINANYLFEFEEAFTPTAPLADVIDTLSNPVDFRLRGNVGWSRGRIGSSVFVNYTDSYTNDRSAPEQGVDAWTTVDLQLRYDLSGPVGSGANAALSVQNVFDEDPPFANNPAGIAYDPANASASGRFVALQVTKAW